MDNDLAGFDNGDDGFFNQEEFKMIETNPYNSHRHERVSKKAKKTEKSERPSEKMERPS